MSSNVFTSQKDIQIRLVRCEDDQKDDRILIRYKDEDMYQLFYHDGNLTDANSVYLTVVSGDELDVYMDSLCSLLVRDTDPFKRIEFQIPCFPCLQFGIQQLREKKLRNALKNIMPILKQAAKY